MAKKKEIKQTEVVTEDKFAKFQSLFATGTATRLDLAKAVDEFFGSAKIDFVDSRQFSIEVDGVRIPKEGHLIVCR
jgi:folate-dependent tRNA-U54 methylase TrmFO/GidA